MADSILRLKVESQEYDAKLKRAAEGLQKYTDGCRKAGGTLEFVEQETLEFVRALGNMETTSRSAKGSISEMTKAFTDLTAQYNKMTDAEKQSPYGKAMSESLNTLKGRIQESKKEIDDINQSLNGGGGLSGALDAVADKFGLNIEQLTKFGSAAGLVTTALKVAKDAFFQSESNIDEWGRTVESAKSAYNIFLDTLNNGNWSNFFSNLETAIKGGRDLYDVFDRLGSIKSNNAAAIAIVQQQIAQLRLAKQQGENVDAQLKAATQRLAQLQGQSVAAGKAAGTQSAFQTIRSGVNSIGGAGVNDATINYAIQRIMQNGQSEFDKYKYNRDALREKGMVTRTQTIYDSQGGTYERQYREFDINALTKEQQKQYALAQAITEGETRIQQGIATYAQAVQEGAASAREEFKGNRYALQGSGGGGHSGGGVASLPDIADFNKQLTSSLKDTGALKPEDILGPSEAYQAYTASIKQNIESVSDSTERLTDAFVALNKAEGVEEGLQKLDKTASTSKQSFGMAASAAGALGSALAGIEDPGARAAGLVLQSLASIALGFASAAASPAVTGTGWGWLAFVGAGLAAVATTISTIHQLTGFAEGGIVGGNSYSGDNVYAGNAWVNSGELVLNKAQQGNLASQLSGNGLQNIAVSGRVKGTDIILSIDRSLQLQGKQLLTWGR